MAVLPSSSVVVGRGMATPATTSTTWSVTDGPHRVAAPGDLVILYTSPQAMVPVVLRRFGALDHKFGRFSHDDIIGKPFGSKVWSRSARGGGYVYLLQASPELWTHALAHRTQILYFADISTVTQHLNLRPGSVVVESGTGSGSLTTSMARTVAPSGHVYTFEFNADRVGKARDDFERLGVHHLVTVTHGDACADGFLPHRLSDGVDAVFLDLPQPWLAVPHATRVLKRNGRLCCFSPCMEQVMRNAATLAEQGYEDIVTVECLSRFFVVTGETLRHPPSLDAKRQPGGDGAEGGGSHVTGVKRRRDEGGSAGVGGDAEGGAGQGVGRPRVVGDDAVGEGDGAAAATAHGGASEGGNGAAVATDGRLPLPWPAWLDDVMGRVGGGVSHSRPRGSGGSPSIQQLAAARGHTAYLTFACLYRKPVLDCGSGATATAGGEGVEAGGGATEGSA